LMPCRFASGRGLLINSQMARKLIGMKLPLSSIVH
jgi:hypothetical protein